MRIRTHLVLLVCAVLLPVLVFAAVLTGLFWLQQRANFDRRYLDRVRTVSLALDTEIEASIRVLQALEFTSEIASLELSQFAGKARRVLISQPSWSAIVLADSTGKWMLEVGREKDSLARGAVDSNTVKRVTAGVPAVSGLVRLEDGRHVTEIADPVMQGNSLMHVLVAYIDASFWLEFLRKIKLSTDATMTLLDQDGIVIARTLNNEKSFGKRPAPTLYEKSRESTEGAYRSVGLEGQWFYSAHSRSAASNWTVATGVPADSVEAALRGSALWMMGTALLTGMLAFFFAVVLGRRIAEPVSALAASAKSLISRGAVTVPAPQRSGIDEVENVARAFDEARALLHEREQALNDALAGEQRARAVAEAANRGKDEFLAMLGHELRNPLSVIANAVTVMDRAGSDAAAAVRSREMVTRQITHLRQLVDDLLDVARVTTGKIVLNTRALDLAKIARQSIGVLQDAHRLTGHQIEADLAEAWVVADETRIEQIMTNLLENAAKYTPPGGRIRVRVMPDKRTAVLEVSDTGTGIAPNLLPYVFDIFTQGERTLDRSQGGLGLGLTLVRRLVELHHGRVAAASEGLGRGATFTVVLPRIDVPAAAAEPAPANPPSAPRLRVLIVEDNADGRETLKTILTLCGHEVHEAADGLSGAEVAISVRPDIALIDIGLPGIDGYEVARRVRASPSGRGMKLVAFTGYGQEEDLRRARHAGFDACLVKPIEPAVLERILAGV